MVTAIGAASIGTALPFLRHRPSNQSTSSPPNRQLPWFESAGDGALNSTSLDSQSIDESTDADASSTPHVLIDEE